MRWWLVHEPAKDPKKPLPLVLVLHGGGGDPAGAARMSDMDAVADREGFIALYPAGTGLFSRRLLTWNSGNCCGYAQRNESDDSGFLAALIERFIKEGRADPRRVYATGLSNGAMMSQRLGCEHGDLIAAIAPVAGQLNIPSCEPKKPVSVLMIHGLKDEHAPYDGCSGKKMFKKRVDRSVKESLELWSKADGCGAPSGTDDYQGCRDKTEVRLITHDGGHIWPGGRAGIRFGNVDPVLAEPKATELIEAFFKAHPKNP